MSAATSRATVVWNIVGYLLYVVLLVVGSIEAMFAGFFGMATDACYDAACDASYHVWPAMLTMWIGVGVVLLLTSVAMLVSTVRGKIVIGWPFIGALGLAAVYLIALKVLH
ncbi:hypothetical protein BHQ16_09165 [Mycobacterium shimoidei]|nr:hypothetical protein [Mycobacterium shimoidei]ODR13829.1 hypothetical protein BHQ16_09165 [Mycobacterium shimoidei]